MTWKIRYYITENAYKSGIASYEEIKEGTRDYIIGYIQKKLKTSNYKSILTNIRTNSLIKGSNTLNSKKYFSFSPLNSFLETKFLELL